MVNVILHVKVPCGNVIKHTHISRSKCSCVKINVDYTCQNTLLEMQLYMSKHLKVAVAKHVKITSSK